jgi:hypothetical protein
MVLACFAGSVSLSHSQPASTTFSLIVIELKFPPSVGIASNIIW